MRACMHVWVCSYSQWSAGAAGAHVCACVHACVGVQLQPVVTGAGREGGRQLSLGHACMTTIIRRLPLGPS